MAGQSRSGDIIVDRRRASRLPVRFDVAWSLNAASFQGTAKNLTPQGIFIETDEEMPVGTPLELTLYLPDDGPLAKVFVDVTRPSQRQQNPSGFGAEFRSLDESTRARVSALLQSSKGGH